MNRRFTIIGICALLALVVCFAFLSRDGRRRAAKTQLVIAPDGTIAVPQNDNVTIVAEVPKLATNASPAGAPPRKN